MSGTGRARAERTAGALGSGAEVNTARRDWLRSLWEELRELARPMLAYWVLLTATFASFSFAAILHDPSPGGMLALAYFAFITAASVAMGQGMAILRIRDWVVYLYWATMWTVGMAFGIFASAAAGPLGVFIVIWVLLGPLFTLGGLWSLRVGRAMFSTWVPLVYAAGTAIIVAESNGQVGNWHAGSKWAIWNVLTFGALGLAITLVLVFLASRERHRLGLWRRAPGGLLKGSVAEVGAARPRLSILGWLMLAVLGAGLSVGTAIMAPYLWRTAPDDEGEPNGEQVDGPSNPDENGQPQQPEDGGKEGKPHKPSKWEGKRPKAHNLQEGMENAKEQVEEDLQRSAQQGVDLLATLLMAILQILGLLLVFFRPVKRLLTVRHLRRPFWKVPATARVTNSWRLVEIAIGDAGLQMRRGEPAESLVKRALPLLERISPGGAAVHGLADAAALRDRIVYGLGIAPDDLALMDEAATWAYDTVWERLGDRDQLKAVYRGLDLP